MNYTDLINRHSGKCELCDNRAKRLLASNVYDPSLKKDELRGQNFRQFCEECSISHINWIIKKAVGCGYHLYIWEMKKDGTTKEL